MTRSEEARFSRRVTVFALIGALLTAVGVTVATLANSNTHQCFALSSRVSGTPEVFGGPQGIEPAVRASNSAMATPKDVPPLPNFMAKCDQANPATACRAEEISAINHA
jgi:hypothetical protein